MCPLGVRNGAMHNWVLSTRTRVRRGARLPFVLSATDWSQLRRSNRLRAGRSCPKLLFDIEDSRACRPRGSLRRGGATVLVHPRPELLCLRLPSRHGHGRRTVSGPRTELRGGVRGGHVQSGHRRTTAMRCNDVRSRSVLLRVAGREWSLRVFVRRVMPGHRERSRVCNGMPGFTLTVGLRG
jgi:hypothetical protein